MTDSANSIMVVICSRGRLGLSDHHVDSLYNPVCPLRFLWWNVGFLEVITAPFRVLINALFSARVRVEGDSMTPTLEDGQSVLVVRPAFPWNRLRRGDVVVLTPPAPTPGLPADTWFIKRLAGMPNEEIVLDGSRVYADDLLLAELPGPGHLPGHSDNGRREWWNGPDEYFVLGDNPVDSRDSRAFGPVSGDRIIGRVWLRIWPPSSFGPVR